MLEKLLDRRNPDSKAEGDPKRIAIATEGTIVCEHFGHCEGFTIYTTNYGRILQQEFLPNPGHPPGLLPRLLIDHGIDGVIAGDMDDDVIGIFIEKRIEAYTGAKGELDHVIEDYLADRLTSSA